jgi:two-component system chemotaxis response regulator CheY
MKQTNVLIVDDSAFMRSIVRRTLSAVQGLEFFEAGDGEEAETILQGQLFDSKPIDLIVLDWHMPKVSGLEFLRAMRAAGPFSSRPAVIMVTAETYPEQIAACKAYKISSYVTKPFTAEELCAAVAKALDSGKAAHAV